MLLKLCSNHVQTLAAELRIVAVVLACLALPGCINSATPILGDAKAILGDRIQIHFFSATKDGRRDYSTAIFEWNGSRYLPRGNAVGDWPEFTIHPYEGRDFIVRNFDHAPSLTKEMLLARDRYTCAYCAQRFKYEQLDLEHIVPRSRGGRDSWMNLVAACKPLNRGQGA